MARIACLVGLLAAGCATPLESRSWLRVRTAHFELVSGAERSRTLEIVERLELLRAVLTRFGVRVRLEPRVPLLFYVFGDAAEFARFRPMKPFFVGYMLPRAHRNFLVIHAGKGGWRRARLFTSTSTSCSAMARPPTTRRGTTRDSRSS